MLKTTLYAEISAIGGLGMTLSIEALDGSGQKILLITLIGLLALGCATARLMAHFHRIPAPLFEPKMPANLDIARLPMPGLGAGGTTIARPANSNAGLANAARVRYSGASASGASRSRLRQLQ